MPDLGELPHGFVGELRHLVRLASRCPGCVPVDVFPDGVRLRHRQSLVTVDINQNARLTAGGRSYRRCWKVRLERVPWSGVDVLRRLFSGAR